MRNLSDALRARMADNTTLTAKASLLLADGTREELTGTDIFALSHEAATSSDSTFDVGAAVMATLSVTLNNWDGRFDAYDFTGATLTAWVGAGLPDGTTEWVKLGVFDVDQPDSYSGRVELSCLDHLSRMERPVTDVDRPLPCTAQELAQAICDRCGVVLQTATIPNGTYVIGQEVQLDETDTCLDAIGWVAQLTGTYARCDAEGRLTFSWYDMGAISADGTAAEGKAHVTAHGATQLKVMTDDVVVTGVRVTAENQVTADGVGEDGETALSGSEGYVLELTGNRLVTYGNAATVAAQVAKRVVGLRFRPFEATCLTDLSAEPGDPIEVADMRGNPHMAYLTRVTLTANSPMLLACSAEPAARNSATSASAATKASVAAREEIKREAKARVEARKAADAASAEAVAAREAATAAQGVADRAVSAARSAQKSADDAATDAANAQSTADEASAAASAAQARADAASSSASAAQKTADTAKTNAEAAQSTADGAASAAKAAQSTADAAKANAATAADAASAAQGVADKAKADASTAQAAADKAKADAKAAQDAADAVAGDLSKNYSTTTEVNKKIDDISVGGRNYCANALMTPNNLTVESFDVTTGIYTITNPSTQATGMLLFKSKEYAAGTYCYTFKNHAVEFVCTKRFDSTWVHNDYYSSLFDSSDAYTTREWSYSGTFVATEPFQFGVLIDTVTSAPVGPIKLELGNKATDWSPAPEDLQSAADAAKARADEAQAAADAAKANADTAQAGADAAKAAADKAAQDAATAQGTADTAKANASAAQKTADTAKSNADAAQKTADTAKANASTAQATADKAKTDAANAQATADTAKTNAGNAQKTADTAKANADAAQKSADDAQAAADAAQATADEAKEAASKAQSTADAAMEAIANQIATAGGLFTTKQDVSDGSTIWYMHDKKDLSASSSVWKFTADTVSVSSDGMKTWTAALNASGTAILQRVYAVGIDADYITSGRIASRNGASYIDLDTGDVRLSSSVIVGDRELRDTIDGLNENVDELFRKTSYVTVGQDADGSPVLKLGTNVNDFSVQITNSAIRFMQGSQAVAYITNQQLYIQSSVITDELKIGGGTGFVWKRRENNHLGLRYVAG